MRYFNFAIFYFAIAFFCLSVIYFAPDYDDKLAMLALLVLAMYSGGQGGYYLWKQTQIDE